MKIAAVEQSGIRIQWAEDALGQLKVAKNYEEAEKAWAAFLLAANSIYSKLEQGAKGNGRSEAWYGRVKRQRKGDPILRYLHFARNSDEHGIENVTKRHNAGWGLPFGQGKATKINLLDQDTFEPTGEQIDCFLYGEQIVAITAHDRRYGDSCDPPAGKLSGRDGTNPQHIGEAAIELLKDLLEEAAKLV